MRKSVLGGMAVLFGLAVLFQADQSSAMWLENTNIRIKTLGDARLAFDDESTRLTLLNLGNPAGLVLEEHANQLTLAVEKPDGEILIGSGNDPLEGLLFSLGSDLGFQVSLDYWSGEAGDETYTPNTSHTQDLAGRLKAAWRIMPDLAFGGTLNYNYQPAILRVGDYEKKKRDLLGWNFGAGHNVENILGKETRFLTGVVVGNLDDQAGQAYEVNHDIRYWGSGYNGSYYESVSYLKKNNVSYNPESLWISAQSVLQNGSNVTAGLIVDYMYRNADETTVITERNSYSYYPVTAGASYTDAETVFQDMQTTESKLGVSAVIRWLGHESETSEVNWSVRYTSWGSQAVHTRIETRTETSRAYTDGSAGTYSETETVVEEYLETYEHHAVAGMEFHSKSHHFKAGWQLGGFYATDMDGEYYSVYEQYPNRYGGYGGCGVEYQIRPFLALRAGVHGEVIVREVAEEWDRPILNFTDDFSMSLGAGIGIADDFILDLYYVDGFHSDEQIGLCLKKPL